MAVMQKLTMASFVEQIRNHVWPATRLALNNYCGLKDNGDIAINANVDNNLNVTFVASPRSGQPIPGPLDIEAKPVQLPPPLEPIAPRAAANKYAYESLEQPPARTEMDHGLRKGWFMEPAANHQEARLAARITGLDTTPEGVGLQSAIYLSAKMWRSRARIILRLLPFVSDIARSAQLRSRCLLRRGWEAISIGSPTADGSGIPFTGELLPRDLIVDSSNEQLMELMKKAIPG